VSSRERTKGNTLIEDRDEEKGERERKATRAPPN